MIKSTADVKAQFGLVEFQWLRNAIGDILNTSGDDYPCSDNFRLALAGDAASEAEYEERQHDGCCDAFEAKLGPSPLGHTYYYGFNYGH